MTLRDALDDLLNGWRSDIDDRWKSIFVGIEPDIAGVPTNLEVNAGEVIFPGRKGHAPMGARSDSHIFRALDGIGPDDVSVVVIGQDPYQKVSQATGRSFEQGDLTDWLGHPTVSPSLKRIIQSLAAFRSSDVAYSNGGAGWTKLLQDIGNSTIQVPGPLPLWDKWQGQGVLFINAILTFNRADPAIQFDGHGRAWAPIIKAILGHLVRRQNKSLVFVAWGDKAKRVLETSGAIQAARDAGTWDKSVVMVQRPHPNARPTNDPPFLRGTNPFVQINQALTSVGAQQIAW